MATKQIEREQQNDIVRIESERKTPSDQMNVLCFDVAETVRGIEEAAQAKLEAKASYGTALDNGDEQGMSAALLRVRQANIQRQKLLDSLDDFEQRLAKLR
ncbi:MAG TPA: hypothetical protein VMW24_24290, partial [Sedimentisphaerales bacterium]|nr:hypothetical protein [Sedimentisphaerales bacterium]